MTTDLKAENERLREHWREMKKAAKDARLNLAEATAKRLDATATEALWVAAVVRADAEQERAEQAVFASEDIIRKTPEPVTPATSKPASDCGHGSSTATVESLALQNGDQEEIDKLKEFLERPGAIRWEGGEQPVGDEVEVVAFRKHFGDAGGREFFADDLSWSADARYAVLAYIVVAQPEPSTPETPEAAGDEGGEAKVYPHSPAYVDGYTRAAHGLPALAPEEFAHDPDWSRGFDAYAPPPAEAPQPVSDHVRENGEGDGIPDGFTANRHGLVPYIGNPWVETVSSSGFRGIDRQSFWNFALGASSPIIAYRMVSDEEMEKHLAISEQRGHLALQPDEPAVWTAGRPFIDDTEVIHPDPTLQSGETGGAYDAKHEAEVPDAGIFEALRKPVDEAADAPAPVDMMEA